MPRLFRSPLTTVATAALAGSVLLGGGAAWAAWSVSGTGAGATTTGSLVTPTLTATRSTTSPTSAIDLSWTAAGQLPGTTYSVKRDGTTISCTSNLCTDSGLAPGTTHSYVVTAKVGSSWSAASSPSTASTATSTVSTTTTVTSSPNPAKSGVQVTLTATVTASSGTPTGSVTFKDGSTTIACTGGSARPLTAGSATCQTSFATSGTHSITAGYPGDAGFAASTSATLTQRVVNAAVAGIGFVNVKVGSTATTASCSGAIGTTYTCVVSGGPNATVTADLVFVDSTGAATPYIFDSSTTIPWDYSGKSSGSSSSVVAAGESQASPSVSAQRNGNSGAGTVSVTFTDGSITYTAVLRVQ